MNLLNSIELSTLKILRTAYRKARERLTNCTKPKSHSYGRPAKLMYRQWHYKAAQQAIG